MKTSRILLFGILFVVIIAFIGWVRLPDMVADHLSEQLQVAVEIDSIGIGPKHITVEEIEIGNPEGYTLPRSFSTKRVTVDAPLLHYFDQNVIINEIDLNNVYLGIEFVKQGSKKGNWFEIMNHYKESTESSSKKHSAEEKKSVLIKRLVLTDIAVDLAYQDSGKVQHLQKIDRLEFTNITSEGGIPADQITQVILGQMLKSVFSKENLENMVEGLIQSPEQGVQNLLEPFKSFIE